MYLFERRSDRGRKCKERASNAERKCVWLSLMTDPPSAVCRSWMQKLIKKHL